MSETKRREFIVTTEAWWYAAPANKLDPNITERVSITIDGNAGTTADFKIEWHVVGNDRVPQLKMFDDAWWVLTAEAELFAWLAAANDKNIPPQKLCTKLQLLGFKDATPRESADAPDAPKFKQGAWVRGVETATSVTGKVTSVAQVLSGTVYEVEYRRAMNSTFRLYYENELVAITAPEEAAE